MTLPRRPLAIELVVDTSALIAALLNEPTRDQILQVLQSKRGMSAISSASLLESAMVMASRKGPHGLDLLDEFVNAADIVAMPIDTQQLILAREAWLRFGRGNHPAQLNFGDCFSYALAAHCDVALLCTGNDFAQTDLSMALGKVA